MSINDCYKNGKFYDRFTIRTGHHYIQEENEIKLASFIINFKFEIKIFYYFEKYIKINMEYEIFIKVLLTAILDKLKQITSPSTIVEQSQLCEINSWNIISTL